SLFMLLTGNGRIGKREALAGVMLGIPNYFSSRFLLYSLQTLDAIIVYPMYSVLTVIVITLLGMGIWHERITKRTALGMLLILLSVAFMNVR
ncbi:MAG: EamA family transporter, partial [Merdibacter sp.]|nr:EamA family transporter [Merdibacter sp.]